MKLYDYPKSSAAYRVRIACNLKGVEVETVLVNLVANEQREPGYLAVAPAGLTPTLVDEGQVTLSQSLAIITYLDAKVASPRLIPDDPIAAARAWELALTVACDIHPLNNLRVLRYIKAELHADDAARDAWYAHWVQRGFEGMEAKVAADGPYCLGETLTIADVCLVPQMFNARRFKVDVAAFPRLVAIDAHLQTVPAFAAAAPA